MEARHPIQPNLLEEKTGVPLPDDLKHEVESASKVIATITAPKKRRRLKTSLSPEEAAQKVSQGLSDKIFKRAARAASAPLPRLKTAQEILDAPFDPTSPLTEQDRQLTTISQDPTLSVAHLEWQDTLAVEGARSLNEIVRLRDHATSEKLRFDAAKDIADRAGIDLRKKAPTQVNLYANVPTEQLVEALRRMDRLAPPPQDGADLPAGAEPA